MRGKALKYRLYFGDGDHFRDEDGRTEFGQRRAEQIKKRMYPTELEAVRWPPIGPAWLLIRVTHEEAEDILNEDTVIRTGWGTYITPQEIIQITPERTCSFEISESKFRDGGKAHDIQFGKMIIALDEAELDDLFLAVARRISERAFYQDGPEAPIVDPGKQL